jgi:signal transduction histidine kinase
VPPAAAFVGRRAAFVAPRRRPAGCRYACHPMTADPAPPLAARPLDAPLPAELAGRGQGWFTHYRRHAVFSRPWVLGRWRLVAPWLALVFLGMAPLLLADDPRDRPWPIFTALLVTLVLPAVLGPALGLWIRRRGWAPHVEWRALLAMVLLLTAGVAAFYLWLEDPFKDAVARTLGIADEHGRRQRVTMTLGFSISTAGPPGALPTSVRDDPGLLAVNTATRALLAFCLGGGLALRGWRREREGLAALERERALQQAQAARREAELRLSVLAAQVEPHFLFNTLAGVRSAIATDPARASDMIDRLVDYLRASIPRLRGDQAAQATVGAQFDIVRAYLGLMSARMPRLAFALHAPPELRDARFPPLMLISLAENAVKHGVEMKIGPARVDVSAERTPDGRLAVTVADDGVGFGASQAGSGLGLANIRERLAQLYGDAASLVLKARPEGGVAATITVPLESA